MNMNTSRAMVLKGPGHLELQEFPLPEISNEDGLLKLELIGVCGSDPGIYRGKTRGAPRPYPLILGHEIVGRVVKMGQKARQRHGVSEGDRVIVEYAFGCGNCSSCLEGKYVLCQKFYSYGSMISCASPPHLFGAYADYLYIHPRAMVHKIGEDISPETGVLISAVLGNAVRWLCDIGGLSLGQRVVIVGPGQQGLGGVVAAREAGAAAVIILGTGRDKERLKLAKKFGADEVIDVDSQDPVESISKLTGGKMADIVMDATGHPSGAATALAVAGKNAAVVLPGLYGAETEVPLLLDTAVLKELRLLGAFSQNYGAVERAINIARKGEYPFAELISHRLPLEKAEEAVLLTSGEIEGELPLKVVLDPTL